MNSKFAGRGAVWTAAVSAIALEPHVAPFALGAAVAKEVFDLVRARSSRLAVLSYLDAAHSGMYLNIEPSGLEPAVVVRVAWPPCVPSQHEEGARSVASDDFDLDRFCIEHRQELLSYAYAECRCWQDAEDAVNDALVKMWDHFWARGVPPGKGNLVGWTKRVISNSLKDLARRAKVEQKHRLRLPSVTADFSHDVDDEIVAQDAMVFIQGLEPKLRQIGLLRYADGLRTKEIAEILGVSDSSVRSDLCRINKKMREYVGVTPKARQDHREETTT